MNGRDGSCVSAASFTDIHPGFPGVAAWKTGFLPVQQVVFTF
jgi:hypothetical protein